MGHGRFIVCLFFSLFKGRRDLNLFKYHWEGSQLRERLNNAGKRKDSLFNKY